MVKPWQRARNVHVRDGVGEDEFVALREARDGTLDMPKLILPLIQVTLDPGKRPGRAVVAAGGKWQALPEDPHRRLVRRRWHRHAEGEARLVR